VTHGSHNPAVLSPALATLFPAGVWVAELREPADLGLLPEAERACVQGCAPKRVGEFAAGRLCARRALGELGIADAPLLVSADRHPAWPATVTGSVTHTEQHCAAVVGLRARFDGLGIDTEAADAVGEELWAQICSDDELLTLRALAPELRAPAAALIFSAKEAFYKCQYPLTRQWLEFKDVRVEPESWLPITGSFLIHPMRNLRIGRWNSEQMYGRFLFHGNFVSAGFSLVRLVVSK